MWCAHKELQWVFDAAGRSGRTGAGAVRTREPLSAVALVPSLRWRQGGQNLLLVLVPPVVEVSDALFPE